MALKLQRVITNPIFAGTLLFIYGGGLVSLGCAASQSQFIDPTTWFAIAFVLALAITLTYAIATNSLHRYRLAFLTMIGVNLSLNVGHISWYINATIGALQAVSAGLIFAEIMLFFWVLLLGSGRGTYLADLCDAGIERGQVLSHAGGYSRGPGGNHHSMMMQQRKSSYRNTINHGSGEEDARDVNYFAASGHESTIMSGKMDEDGNTSVVYKARALYPYDANPDDPNEVSITKDEVMLVIDDSGKWWQVKKEDGSVGIAPSNYLTRIASSVAEN